VSVGRSITSVAKAAAKNKAVQGAAAAAAAKLAANAEPALRERYDRWSGGRTNRLLAIRLARQIQGTYSEGTIIASTPHYVVWKAGAPVEAFPPVEDLELRPELRDFDQRLLKVPPPERRRLIKR
jgi:hypothetical protein